MRKLGLHSLKSAVTIQLTLVRSNLAYCNVYDQVSLQQSNELCLDKLGTAAQHR